MSRVKLSLTFVTAVLDEEDNLPKLGNHLKPFLGRGAEWIVVVDFRTTDKSGAVAKKLGARVLQDIGESKGVVFNNKNWGAKEAINDWIFIIDADEEMDKVLQREIIETVNRNEPPFVWETGFINIEFGRRFEKCDIPQKTFVRLFKKSYFWYDTSATAEGGGIQRWKGEKAVLKGKLIHDTHPTIGIFLEKIDRYSSREAEIRYLNKKDVTNLYLLLNMIYQPIREFIWKYFIWRLYKEGIHGYVVSTIFAFYHFLIWAKYFEVKYRNKR